MKRAAAARPARPPDAWTQLRLQIAMDAAGVEYRPDKARLRRIFNLTRITGMAQLIGWLVFSYTGRGATCHPGQARLARDAGVSIRTVERAVRRLEAAGVIWRRRRRGAAQFRLNLTGRTPPPKARRDPPLVSGLDPPLVSGPYNRKEGRTTEGTPPNPPARGGAARERLSGPERRRRAEADRIAGPATGRVLNACPICGRPHRRLDGCGVGTPGGKRPKGASNGGVRLTSEPKPSPVIKLADWWW